jgi:hypothetical protein
MSIQPLHLTAAAYGFLGFNVSPAAAAGYLFTPTLTCDGRPLDAAA